MISAAKLMQQSFYHGKIAPNVNIFDTLSHAVASIAVASIIAVVSCQV